MKARPTIRRLSATFALAALTTSAVASAAPEQISDETALPSLERELAKDAAKRQVAVFGPVGVANRLVVPALRASADWSPFLFTESNFAWDVLRVTGRCRTRADCPATLAPYRRYSVDMLATNIGFGFRFSRFSLFGLSSLPANGFLPESGSDRVNTVLLINSYTYLLGAAGVVSGGFAGGGLMMYGGAYHGADLDLVAGVTYAANGRAGVTPYTNATLPKIYTVLSAALGPETGLAYLSGGLADLPELLPLRRSLTSLLARQILLDVPRATDDAGVPAETTPRRVALRTLHLEEKNLASLFDVRLVAALPPYPVLHEAQVGVHTPDYHGTSAKTADGAPRKPATFGAGVSAGVVNMPDMRYLAVSGGPKLSFSAEVRAAFARLAVHRNDPDALAMYPYGVDAWSVYFTLQYVNRR